MANIFFQIANPLNERIEILNLIKHKLETGEYDAGLYTQPRDNFEEYIKIKSVAFLTDIPSIFNLSKPNYNKVTYSNIDAQPPMEYWYKIPFELYKDILTHDFKTFNVLTNRNVYYEVINKKTKNVTYLKHKLVNKVLNTGPSFIPQFDKENPQRVKKNRTSSDAFFSTGPTRATRNKEPKSFQFINLFNEEV